MAKHLLNVWLGGWSLCLRPGPIKMAVIMIILGYSQLYTRISMQKRDNKNHWLWLSWLPASLTDWLSEPYGHVVRSCIHILCVRREEEFIKSLIHSTSQPDRPTDRQSHRQCHANELTLICHWSYELNLNYIQSTLHSTTVQSSPDPLHQPATIDELFVTPRRRWRQYEGDDKLVKLELIRINGYCGRTERPIQSWLEIHFGIT